MSDSQEKQLRIDNVLGIGHWALVLSFDYAQLPPSRWRSLSKSCIGHWALVLSEAEVWGIRKEEAGGRNKF